MVSVLSITGMFFALLVSVLLPIALLLFVKKKMSARLFPAAVGAAVFVIAALILERIVHTVIFTAFPVVLKNNTLYIIYGCLAAGIFEETGRLCGFYFLKKRGKSGINHVSSALVYGAGHGGIEAVLLVGFVCISNLILSFSLNAGGIDAVTSGLTGNVLETAKQQLSVLTDTPSAMFFMAGFERIFAFALQISLSVLVWMITEKYISKFWLIGAIILHAAANLPAAFYQTGILKNEYLMEVFIFLGAFFVSLIVTRLYRSAVSKAVIKDNG